jgi:hypothetical protein
MHDTTDAKYGFLDADNNDMDASAMFIRILAASLGTGYIIFGRKRERVAAVLAGVAIILLPYVIDDWAVNVMATYIICMIPLFVTA